MKQWKTLSTKTLLTHKRLNVYEDEVELPNGHRTDYIHFGKAKDASCVIAINSDQKVLVQKEYSYPPNQWLYQFPGGALEAHETPEQGALRELAEEAGQTGSLQSIGWYYLDNRRRPDKHHNFICTGLTAVTAQPDTEEEFETYWLSVAEIDTLITSGQINNSSMLAAWALFKASPLANPSLKA